MCVLKSPRLWLVLWLHTWLFVRSVCLHNPPSKVPGDGFCDNCWAKIFDLTPASEWEREREEHLGQLPSFVFNHTHRGISQHCLSLPVERSQICALKDKNDSKATRNTLVIHTITCLSTNYGLTLLSVSERVTVMNFRKSLRWFKLRIFQSSRFSQLEMCVFSNVLFASLAFIRQCMKP